MTCAWVCLAAVVGFYGTTLVAMLVQTFGRRCPSCGAVRSTVAEAVEDGALRDDPDREDSPR